MKCMTWSEDKEKVVNVMCLLKCEAKKIAAAGEAASSLDDVRVRLLLMSLFHLMHCIKSNELIFMHLICVIKNKAHQQHLTIIQAFE